MGQQPKQKLVYRPIPPRVDEAGVSGLSTIEKQATVIEIPDSATTSAAVPWVPPSMIAIPDSITTLAAPAALHITNSGPPSTEVPDHLTEPPSGDHVDALLELEERSAHTVNSPHSLQVKLPSRQKPDPRSAMSDAKADPDAFHDSTHVSRLQQILDFQSFSKSLAGLLGCSSKDEVLGTTKNSRKPYTKRYFGNPI